MATTRPRELQLSPEAVSELFKPVRLEIFESLQVAGPALVAELAARLGRPADALYYHLKKLVEIGVVEVREDLVSVGEGPGRQGTVYGLAAQHVSMRLDPGSQRSREAWARGAATVLRQAERDVGAALESGDVQGEGALRNLFLRRTKARLSPRDLKEVNAHLSALYELLRGKAENTDGSLHAVTLVLTPLAERTRN